MQLTNNLKVLLGATALLILPLAASQFVEGWLWGPFDYVFAWVMFASVGLLFNFVVSRYKGQDADYKLATALALLAAFLIVWVNLAVGFIGSEDNPINLLFFAMLLMGGIAALLSGFRREGMARAMFLTAGLQALVPLLALMVKEPAVTSETPGILGIFVLNGFFIFLWIASGLLYKGGKAVEGIGWIFGTGVLLVGLINTFWGNDMGFGIFLILLSLLYFPSALNSIESRVGFRISRIVKIPLAAFIMWAAVGVGELFDKVDLMLASFRTLL